MMRIQSRTLIRVAVIMALAVIVTLAAGGVGATAREFPIGTYTTTIFEEDVPAFFPPEAVAILVGHWQNEFTADGGVIVSKNGEFATAARYVANPARFVTTDLYGPLACTEAPGEATGVYRWMFSDGELTLSPIVDHCFGRQFVLTVRAWEKQ